MNFLSVISLPKTNFGPLSKRQPHSINVNPYTFSDSTQNSPGASKIIDFFTMKSRYQWIVSKLGKCERIHNYLYHFKLI